MKIAFIMLSAVHKSVQQNSNSANSWKLGNDTAEFVERDYQILFFAVHNTEQTFSVLG